MTSLTMRIDSKRAIDHLLPLLEGGLEEGFISQEEAGAMLVEEVVRTITVEVET